MPKTIKYLTKEILEKINHISTTIYKYNRTIPQHVIDALEPETLIAVTFEMIHEHIAGRPADPHMRCVMQPVGGAHGMLILDMPMELYDVLPSHTVEDTPNEEHTAANVPQGV